MPNDSTHIVECKRKPKSKFLHDSLHGKGKGVKDPIVHKTDSSNAESMQQQSIK